MNDLKKYMEGRKKRDPEFAKNLEQGYEEFKIGVLIRQTREKVGLTQEQLARKLGTHKAAISRIENRARDIRLGTLERVAHALGKHLHVAIK